jgi:outer membrane protein OmpA-like peptidoglycan-associated protein
MVVHSPPTAEATTARAPAGQGGRLAAPVPQPAGERAVGRAVAHLLRTSAAGNDAAGSKALAAAASTRRLARCAGGSCGCRSCRDEEEPALEEQRRPTLARCAGGACACGTCGHDEFRPEDEMATIRGFFAAPPTPRRVLARRPAYRPSPSWASRDPSQAEEACQPLPQWLANDKWDFWSTAFPLEAARRASCDELEQVWDAYFNATGSPRYVWTEATTPTSCILRSLKNDDDHIPWEDRILDDIRRRAQSFLPRLRGQSSVTLSFRDAGVPASFLTPALNLNNNTRAGGQLFGGVGSSEYGPDTRRLDGTVELTKEVDPNNRLWVQIRPRFTMHWHITDGVDFCPGNTGESAHWMVRLPVLNLSWLEASGMARDIYVEADYNRIRNDVPYGPFPNPDLIDPNPPQVVTVPGRVLFDFNSHTLRPEAAEALATALGNRPSQLAPGRIVEVRGHTDSRGSDEYNDRLSQQRADAVKEFLEDRYPNLRGRIHAVGRGEREPVAPNEIDGRDNPAGRALNRRVEIEFDAQVPSSP